MADEEIENTDIVLEEPVEDRLLKIHVSQDNGIKAKVFSVLPTEQGPRWRCHVCQVTVFGSRTIYKHEQSKEHTENMESPSHSPSKFQAQSPPPKPRQTLLEINLAPGEPVPPGFEGEVQGVTQIQSKLDKFNDAPLIGLEYLVELLYFEDGREPQYICILCDKRGDPRTVMAHLTSYNHRLKYIDTHFHAVSKKMSSYRNDRNYRRGCQTLVVNIAEYIEKRFGRLAPHACEKEAFEKKREHYTQTIVRDVHFSDKNGETFEEFVKEEYFEAPTGMPQVNEPPVPGCKSASVEPKKRSPSPPVVSAPGFKKKPTPRDDRRNLSPVSSVSSSSLSDSPLRSRSRSGSRNRLLYQHNRRYPFRRTSSRERVRSRSRNRRYGGSRSRSPSPRGRRYGGRETYQSRYKPGFSTHTRPRSDFVLDRRSNKALATESARWEEYRREMTKIEKDLEAILHSHEKNPEKHPQYPEEWKKFWNRRYKELQAEHKDPAKHDFKPEWIEFWNKRMHELHEIEMRAKKEFLRKRLNLPEEPPQPIKFRINSKKSAAGGGKPTKLSPEPEVILIDDSKTSDEEFERITPDKFETTKRSHSPWEDDFSRKVSRERSRDRSLDQARSRTRDRSRDRARDFERARDLNRIRELERSRDFERSREHYSAKHELYVGHRPPYERAMYSVPVYKKVEEEVNEGPMNVVAVLRLLTALEEKLGSLGPKVIDMLSQALALEKAEANSSETLLDNDVNCVLFETVKEKLKGQLLAGMIDACAEKPAKNAVKQIASLLHMASERKREKEKIEKEQGIKPQPVSVPGVGAVDKSAIAKQIATALVQQGRTDVTQAELEQLINAVVGMAEVSQKTGAPVSTADYVNQLKVSSMASTTKNATNEKRTEENTSGTALQILQNAYNEPLNNAMDGLSDSDLETLLQNFKDLSTDEQHRLITYLKKLEAKEPERVERLRKFVNLGPTSQEKEETRAITKDRESPFSTRLNELNAERKSVPEKTEIPPYVKIDSEDDDDYSFEDVFKAASKNLKDKQLAKEQERRLADESMKSKADDPNAVLKDAKMLIANLMGQLGQKNVNSSSSSNLLGFSLPEQTPRTVPVPILPEPRNTPSVPVANERLPPPVANPNSQYGAQTNQFPGYSDYSNHSQDQYAGYRKQNDYPQQNYNNYDGNNANYPRHFDGYNNYNSNYDSPMPPAGNQDFNNYPPVDMYGNYNQNNYNQGPNPPNYGNPQRGYNNQQRYF